MAQLKDYPSLNGLGGTYSEEHARQAIANAEAVASIVEGNTNTTIRRIQTHYERTVGTFGSNTTDFQDANELFVTGVLSSPKPTISDTFEAISTSANDNPSGTGARTTAIIYLDANGDEQEYTFATNGQTPVPLTGLTATAFNYVYHKTTGSLGVGDGDVSIRKVGSPSIIYGGVAARGNMSKLGIHTVANGYKAVIRGVTASAIGNDIEMSFRGTNRPYDLATNDVFLFKENLIIPAGTSIAIPLYDIEFFAGQTFKVSGKLIGTSQNPRMFGTISFDLVKVS